MPNQSPDNHPTSSSSDKGDFLAQALRQIMEEHTASGTAAMDMQAELRDYDSNPNTDAPDIGRKDATKVLPLAATARREYQETSVQQRTKPAAVRPTTQSPRTAPSSQHSQGARGSSKDAVRRRSNRKHAILVGGVVLVSGAVIGTGGVLGYMHLYPSTPASNAEVDLSTGQQGVSPSTSEIPGSSTTIPATTTTAIPASEALPSTSTTVDPTPQTTVESSPPPTSKPVPLPTTTTLPSGDVYTTIIRHQDLDATVSAVLEATGQTANVSNSIMLQIERDNKNTGAFNTKLPLTAYSLVVGAKILLPLLSANNIGKYNIDIQKVVNADQAASAKAAAEKIAAAKAAAAKKAAALLPKPTTTTTTTVPHTPVTLKPIITTPTVTIRLVAKK